MQYALQNAAPQPTLQHAVTDLEGRPALVITFSGVVTVAPAQQRGIIVRTTPEQPGAPVGFYVPEAFGITLDGATAVVEASLTQVVETSRIALVSAHARTCAQESDHVDHSELGREGKALVDQRCRVRKTDTDRVEHCGGSVRGHELGPGMTLEDRDGLEAHRFAA